MSPSAGIWLRGLAQNRPGEMSRVHIAALRHHGRSRDRRQGARVNVSAGLAMVLLRATPGKAVQTGSSFMAAKPAAQADSVGNAAKAMKTCSLSRTGRRKSLLAGSVTNSARRRPLARWRTGDTLEAKKSVNFPSTETLK